MYYLLFPKHQLIIRHSFFKYCNSVLYFFELHIWKKKPVTAHTHYLISYIFPVVPGSFWFFIFDCCVATELQQDLVQCLVQCYISLLPIKRIRLYMGKICIFFLSCIYWIFYKHCEFYASNRSLEWYLTGEEKAREKEKKRVNFLSFWVAGYSFIPLCYPERAWQIWRNIISSIV